MLKIFLFLKFLFVIVGVLLGVAFLTLLERNLLGFIGIRVGPNKVSFIGIFQPLNDAGKLMNKQINSISNFSFFFYYISSILTISSSFYLWLCFSSEPSPISLKFGFLLIMLFLSINSLNSIVLGWSTFSKYSLLGSIRTLAQLISYEGVLYVCLFILVCLGSTFSIYNNFFHFISFCLLIMPYCFYIWVPSVLAELNRSPFDFSEGESELVSGFNTEFGSGSFTLIFLSEYACILFFSLLSSVLFFFSSSGFFFFFFFFFIIWVRSVLPRYRFDKLMLMAWKFYIPFLTLFFFLVFVSM